MGDNNLSLLFQFTGFVYENSNSLWDNLTSISTYWQRVWLPHPPQALWCEMGDSIKEPKLIFLSAPSSWLMTKLEGYFLSECGLSRGNSSSSSMLLPFSSFSGTWSTIFNSPEFLTGVFQESKAARTLLGFASLFPPRECNSNITWTLGDVFETDQGLKPFQTPRIGNLAHGFPFWCGWGDGAWFLWWDICGAQSCCPGSGTPSCARGQQCLGVAA